MNYKTSPNPYVNHANNTNKTTNSSRVKFMETRSSELTVFFLTC